MKTILAPVDFSEASVNALSFAAELSRRASARLLVTNVLQNEESEEETKNKLKDLESGLKKKFGDLKFESSIAHGDLVTTLKKIMAVHQPDLIVMGTKGASGLKRILIGSNTVHMIANTRIPVLVIPEVARFENFLNTEKNRIVLATDLDVLENEEALDILKKISLLTTKPKLRVLSVRPQKTGLTDVKRRYRDYLLSFFEPEIKGERVTVFSGNVISGINFYLNEHTDTGLLAMIARNSGHLIQKHFTREMASHTHLPLLVMHDGEK